MPWISKEYTCSCCQKDYLFHELAEELEATMNRNIAAQCPQCRQALASKRGSGRDGGQSGIHHGLCHLCQSETEYFNLPNGKHTILCLECSNRHSYSSY